MEKRNNLLSICLALVMVAIIIGSTAIRVYHNHKENLLKVASKRIEEAAVKCNLEETCIDKKTTLGFLIQKGYLEKQIHPISKEFINDTLVIECKDYRCTTELK